MSEVRGECGESRPVEHALVDPHLDPADERATSYLTLAAVALVIGLVLRSALDRTGLWLDEAQTVAISQRPGTGSWGDLYDGLRADGHPPLYYALLRLWMDAFGTSLTALRALSAIIGAAAVAALGVVGQRIGGRSLAATTVALAAVSPFLVRYSSEVRMYSLVTLLAALWWLGLERARRRVGGPTKGDLALVALVVAALLLTHYWSFFLFGAWLLGLGFARDLGHGSTGRRLLAAHVIGGIAFVSWLPAFLYQVSNTGTPWSGAPNPASIAVSTAADLAGGRESGAALALMILLTIFALVGVAGRRTGVNRFEIDLAGRVEARPLAWLVVGSIGLATAVLTVTDTAFASRYLAIVAGFILVLVGRGVLQLGPTWGPAALVAMLGLGTIGGWHAVDDVRSQGAEVADAIADGVTGDDLVVVCPDQLGPATTAGLAATSLGSGAADTPLALAYPELDDAARVDWVDYLARHTQADPSQVADRIIEQASGAPVWLVWQDGYRGIEAQCSVLRNVLAERYAPANDVVVSDAEVFEPMWLTSFVPEP